MKTIDFEGKTYNIIEDHRDSKEYQWVITDVTRIRDFYAWYPVILNWKFRWFKRIKIQDVLHISRGTTFDDGLTYCSYWKAWYSSWDAQKIID